MSGRTVALAQALLVTFLWSTSWVLIKLGLVELELQPLTFAGLRYASAALILLAFAMPAIRTTRPWQAGRDLRVRVVLLGVLLYTVAQGAQFAALVHLPAAAVGLVLTTTPVLVAFASMAGRERPSPAQIAGIGALVVGAALYFGPFSWGETAVVGLAIAAIGMAANAAAALLGRGLARDALPQLGGVVGLTALTMAVGGAALLVVGLTVEGVPALTAEASLLIGWLALVNTAFAFTLWNQTLRTLSAVESSAVNNLMLVQIALLAWLFLGEALTIVELAGLAVALGGIFAVQLAPLVEARRRRSVVPVAGVSDVPSVSSGGPGR